MPGPWTQGTYQQMPYFVLLPVNYNAGTSYPVILFLHQYQNDTGQPTQTDPWFNTDAFRAAHPCIVVVPLCKIGTQTSTPTFNWGGVDSNLQQPIVSALAILDLIVTQYKGDKTRLYLTGNSMGGLGTWGVLTNPDQRGRFAAAMPVSGSCYYNIGKEDAIAAALKTFPIWSCHGSLDTQVRPAFDIAMFAAMQKIGGIMKFTNDPNGQHDTWDRFYADPATWNWLFAQKQGGIQPPVVTSSPDCTVVKTGSGGTIIDNSGNKWSIPVQIAVNDSADQTTRNVAQLAWVKNTIWHQNVAGNWYSKSSPTDAWSAPTTTSPLIVPPPPPTGAFRVANGLILDPNGKPFLARGVNLYEDHMGDVSQNAYVTPLLTLFPGTNFVRVASYPKNNHPPSYYATFAAQLTAKKIVVLFEDHSGISAPPYTGSDLDFECRWYANMAAAFKDNPYVWFGTFNEPGNGRNMSAIADQEAAIYKAIRGAGSNTIILMELPSGGNSGLIGTQSKGYDGQGPMTPALYASMTNIVWDLHQYGWGSGYSTDPAVVKAALWGSVAACSGVLAAQSVRSADGLVPVIIAEFGDSTDGAKLDANGPLVCQTVGTSGLGFAAWVWALIGPYHDVLTSYGQLTDPYGKQIAKLIADAAARA